MTWGRGPCMLVAAKDVYTTCFRFGQMTKISLDFGGAVPLHHQVAEAIRERIRTGDLRPGDRLPSERELCQELGLSRGTVRQALATLIREGLGYTERGKGNFVAAHKIEQALLSFPSLVLALRSGERRAVTRPLGVSTLPATPTVAERLSIDEGSTIIEVRRLRLLDDEPFLLTTSIVPQFRCPQLASDDHEVRTVYELLERKYGIPIVRVKSILETTVLDGLDADLLSVHRTTPAFRLERIACSNDGDPLVYTVHLIRGDRCRFSFELSEQSTIPVSALSG